MASARTASPAQQQRRREAAQDRLQETLANLDTATAALTNSRAWGQFLDTAARLRDLSFNNAALVWAARPDALTVADYDTWIAQGRHVRRGERGIRLLASVTESDPQTTAPGNVQRIVDVTTVTVFDVQQTDLTDPDQAFATHPLPNFHRGDEQAAAQAFAHFAEQRNLALPDQPVPIDQLVCHITDQLIPKTVAPQVATEASASAAHMILNTYELPTTGAALDFADAWADLPAAVRLRHTAEVGNQAILAARKVFGAVETRETLPARTVQAILGAASERIAAAPAVTTQPQTSVQPRPVDLDQLAAVNADTLDYFRNYGRDKVATDYLASRGISRLPAEYPVGYAPIGGGLVAHLRGLGWSDDTQLAAGVVRRDKNGALRDVFRNRVVGAIRDAAGRIAGFTGRAVGDGEPRYLNTGLTDLFHKSELLYGLYEGTAALRAGAAPVLVEGLLDTLAIATSKPPNLIPVAACGTAFTEHQAAALEAVTPRRRIIIAGDDDLPGRKAAASAGRMMTHRGWTARCPSRTGGLDPADINDIRGGEILNFWLDPALCEPVIYRAAETYLELAGDLSTPEQRMFAGRDVRRQLEEWPLGPERDHAIRHGADLIRFAASPAPWPPPAQPPPKASAGNRPQPPQRAQHLHASVSAGYGR